VDTNNNTRIFKENIKRKGDFSKSLISLFSEIESSFTSEDLKHKQDFLDYWMETNPNGKKERWQMEKVFDIKRRFRTWLRNYNNWSGQGIEKNKSKEITETLKNWGANNA